MKEELSGEIIHPRDFSGVLAKFNIPIKRQDWWLIRWGMTVGFSLLSIVFFYVAFVSGKITLFQLLLGSLAFLLWMGVCLFLRHYCSCLQPAVERWRYWTLLCSFLSPHDVSGGCQQALSTDPFPLVADHGFLDPRPVLVLPMAYAPPDMGSS